MSKGVGVYIGQNEVIAVSAIRSVTGPQIKSYVIEPLHPDTVQEPSVGKEAHKIKKLSVEARAILRALQKIKEPGAYVTAAGTPAQIVTRYFTLPAVPKKEEANAIRFEAARYIPFKISDSVMTYRARKDYKQVLFVTATAIKKEILQKMVRDLREASCKILAIEPAYTAVSRAFSSLRLYQKSQTSAFVIVQSDGNVNLTFAADSTVQLSRDFILEGRSVEDDRKRFTEELRASLDYFYKLTGGNAVQQIFMTGHGDLKSWVEYLEQAFNYTMRFDLANPPQGSKIAPEVLSSILAAYGLAIRTFDSRSPLGEVELLPAEDRWMRPMKFASFLGLGAAGIFLCFFLFRFFLFQPQLDALRAENKNVLNAIASMDPNAVNASAEDLSRQRIELSAKSGLLTRFLADEVIPSELFSALGQGLPRSIWISSVSLEDAAKEKGEARSSHKRLNVRGFCFLGKAENETLTINTWVKSLLERPVIKKAFHEGKLEEIKREKYRSQDATRFQIVFE